MKKTMGGVVIESAEGAALEPVDVVETGYAIPLKTKRQRVTETANAGTPGLIEAMLAESGLPAASRQRIATAHYRSVYAVRDAIVAEREYVKALRLDAIDKTYLGR